MSSLPRPRISDARDKPIVAVGCRSRCATCVRDLIDPEHPVITELSHITGRIAEAHRTSDRVSVDRIGSTERIGNGCIGRIGELIGCTVSERLLGKPVIGVLDVGDAHIAEWVRNRCDPIVGRVPTIARDAPVAVGDACEPIRAIMPVTHGAADIAASGLRRSRGH
jgi:hypothetical protein